jgi:hypothetical protein
MRFSPRRKCDTLKLNRLPRSEFDTGEPIHQGTGRNILVQRGKRCKPSRSAREASFSVISMTRLRNARKSDAACSVVKPHTAMSFPSRHRPQRAKSRLVNRHVIHASISFRRWPNPNAGVISSTMCGNSLVNSAPVRISR